MVYCYYKIPIPPAPKWVKDMNQNEMKSITERQFYQEVEKFIDGCSDSFVDLHYDTDAKPFESDKGGARYYLTRFAEKVFPRFEQEKK